MAPYGWKSARAYFECTNLSTAALYKLTYPEQDCMNLPISKTSLYELAYIQNIIVWTYLSKTQRAHSIWARCRNAFAWNTNFWNILPSSTFPYIDVYVGPHFQNWEFNLNLVEVPPCSDTQLHHLEPKITESLHKLRKVVHVLEILIFLLEILITVSWKYWYIANIAMCWK